MNRDIAEALVYKTEREHYTETVNYLHAITDFPPDSGPQLTVVVTGDQLWVPTWPHEHGC